ncbi:hypothetical protein GXW82_02415 [Streptacidiphilus sp. 4-A2]|nr:hypothetical protein [Streptacidiphilus sp. 4-A2]
MLDPYGLPLLVMETMAVAVIAGLRSLPLAVVAALALGIGQSELTAVHLSGGPEALLQSVSANLLVLALLLAVLLPGCCPRRGRGGGTASGGGRPRPGRPGLLSAGAACCWSGRSRCAVPTCMRCCPVRRWP